MKNPVPVDALPSVIYTDFLLPLISAFLKEGWTVHVKGLLKASLLGSSVWSFRPLLLLPVLQVHWTPLLPSWDHSLGVARCPGSTPQHAYFPSALRAKHRHPLLAPWFPSNAESSSSHTYNQLCLLWGGGTEAGQRVQVWGRCR